MNYEGLLSKHWQHVPTATKFLSKGRFMLAVDESTKMKNSSSKRFKTIKKYLGLMEYRTIMTGTPKPNKLEDLFSQCYLTDLGNDLGEYVTHFRRQYMMPSFSGFGFDAQPGAMERVAAKIAPTTLQLEYEEAVPSQTVDIVLPLPPDTVRHYEELRDEFLTVLGSDVVIAPTSAASLGKLRQFAQGALYFEGNTLPVHDVKLDALESLLAELDGEPLFCLTAFKSDVDRIRGRLGYTVPYIGSGTTAAQGSAWCASFGAGSIPLLLGHPSSVALGVDGLQNNCSNVCWFGQTWSWEEYYQANLRVIRSGSKAEQVFIYRIMMDCGVEKALRLSVEGKRDSEADFCKLLRETL
jgi:SNF2-related domain